MGRVSSRPWRGCRRCCSRRSPRLDAERGVTRLDVVNAFLAATTAAAFLGYRVSGVPALRLMGFGGCLLLFRALPEFLGSVMAILVFGWGLGQDCYGRLRDLHACPPCPHRSAWVGEIRRP